MHVPKDDAADNQCKEFESLKQTGQGACTVNFFFWPVKSYLQFLCGISLPCDPIVVQVRMPWLTSERRAAQTIAMAALQMNPMPILERNRMPGFTHSADRCLLGVNHLNFALFVSLDVNLPALLFENLNPAIRVRLYSVKEFMPAFGEARLFMPARAQRLLWPFYADWLRIKQVHVFHSLPHKIRYLPYLPLSASLGR